MAQQITECFGLFGYGKVRDPQIRIITHIKPDIDAFVAMYLYWKFRCRGKRVVFCLIPAGERVPEIPGVIDVYIDTGGDGPYNHHHTNDRYICSATLVAKDLGIADDLGVIPLIDMACSRDHVEERPDTDLSMLIPGLYGKYKFSVKRYDMPRILREVFILFGAVSHYWQTHPEKESECPTDLHYVKLALPLVVKDPVLVREKLQVLYDIHTYQRESRERIAKSYLQQKPKLVRVLPNEITVALLKRQSRLKGAALQDGIDVIIWSNPDPDEAGDYYGITMSRKVHGKFTLETVYEALCQAERNARSDQVEPNIKWFLHVSGNLVLCGSFTQLLKGDDKSKLPWEVFTRVALGVLEQITLTV